ncbi:methyltransferase domain-containing protein [Actinomycetes bacterium KLBMP 9797]
MRQPMKLVEDNFRRPAGWAGRAVGHLMAVQHRSLTEWTIDLMGIKPADRILDVGCGGGMAVRLLARHAPQGRVAGIDYSPEMVAQARSRNAAAVARQQVEIRPGNAMDLPYPDQSFDHVCAIETFYFWPDPLRGLAEAARVLRPGGQVTVTLEMSREAADPPTALQRVFGRKFTERQREDGLHIISGAELTDLMVRAGLRDARFDSQPRRSLGWLCARAYR